MTLVANARMYSPTPDAAAAWAELFGRVSAQAGVPLTVVPHPFPAPLSDLWARADLGCAFMCGRPWLRAEPRPTPLAAPVPAPARYGGRPVYWTDLLVRADSPFRRLEDTFGHRLGFTIEDSQSGYNAPRHHLLRHRSPARPRLYAESVGPLHTPVRIVEALLAGTIDVGPLDSYAFDLLRRGRPELATTLRVVESTKAAPIPFLVAAPDCTAEVAAGLREALIAVGDDPGLAPVRERLLLAGFVPVKASDYDLLAQWDREAVAAGYDRPG